MNFMNNVMMDNKCDFAITVLLSFCVLLYSKGKVLLALLRYLPRFNSETIVLILCSAHVKMFAMLRVILLVFSFSNPFSPIEMNGEILWRTS